MYFMKFNNGHLKITLKRFGKVLLLVFFAFQLYILARLYLFASCVIPTYSMSPTLQGGDYIITSLQIPGRRIWEKNAEGNLMPNRKKGIREVRKNDVVVFNFPYAYSNDKMILSNKLFYCKRCVALPGENYCWEWIQKMHNIYLPQAGDELSINSLNYEDYRKCIEYETQERLVRKGDVIYLADSVITKYRFRHDYYFMRGDNVKDSYDSRFWGLLPDDFILGVAQFIWFSKEPDTGRIRWSRILKKIE